MINSMSGVMGGMGNMSALSNMSRPPKPPSAEEMYGKLDVNADGSLSTDEVQAMADHMSEVQGDQAPTADDIMAKLDSDGDGALSLAEFEAGRPDGPPPGMQMGMMPPGMGGGSMDISSLFSTGEEQDEQASYLEGLLA